MNISLTILENYPLDSLNTLGLKASARYFVAVTTVTELKDALDFARSKQLNPLPLGGGSNVVFSDHIDTLVIAINLKGRRTIEQKDKQKDDQKNDIIRVQAGAGENWHDFVRWTLEQKAYGLENLSLIPGAVGAAPIQNIGAYGVEIKDSFVALDAVSIDTGELRVFTAQDCAFGYRHSVFKGELCDQYIITSVTFDLNARLTPKLDYGHLNALLNQRLKGQTPTGLEISQAVSDIRQDKLPDPKDLGNAGSFFKNPMISDTQLKVLRQSYPKLVAYKTGTQWKLAAGWLIDKAGLRGFRQGDVGTYEHQALVLVNHGQATGKEVIAFSAMIQQKVMDQFGVLLEREPRIY